MLKAIRSGCLLIVAVCLLFPQSSFASDKPAGNLVSVDWLAKHLHDGDVLVMDASPAVFYATKHIPGAVNADRLSTYGPQETSASEMERIYQSWGVTPTKKIVLYDHD